MVFNALNWADVEEITEANWIQVDQDLRVLHVSFSEVMIVVNPQTCSLVLLAI